ncbi:UNKNOWN [Stylonychia lemnae]|uniref:Transmembrane protein n=1 Tax=Stylonychia lemnae TaxID=5949 RepID=A0A078AL64_STYLE|nr:UNKNOWN [Stylonychia lemnae]|eukprot:CDW83105.1 UNKNOWN [Stylonychia lemnae]
MYPYSPGSLRDQSRLADLKKTDIYQNRISNDYKSLSNRFSVRMPKPSVEYSKGRHSSRLIFSDNNEKSTKFKSNTLEDDLLKKKVFKKQLIIFWLSYIVNFVGLMGFTTEYITITFFNFESLKKGTAKIDEEYMQKEMININKNFIPIGQQNTQPLMYHDIQVILLAVGVTFLLVGTMLEHLKRPDIAITALLITYSAFKIIFGIYDQFIGNKEHQFYIEDYELVHIIICARLALATVFIVDEGFLINEQAISLTSQTNQQVKQIILLDEFFENCSISASSQKFNKKHDGFQKNYNLNEKEKEKILQRYKAPTYLECLKYPGFFRLILCGSFQFFKYRIINKKLILYKASEFNILAGSLFMVTVILFTIEGQITYTLYYSLCIYGPFDFAKVAMLKYNRKYTSLLFGIMCGTLYIFQALIFDTYIYLVLDDRYYTQQSFQIISKSVEAFLSIACMLAILRFVREERMEIKIISQGKFNAKHETINFFNLMARAPSITTLTQVQVGGIQLIGKQMPSKYRKVRMNTNNMEIFQRFQAGLQFQLVTITFYEKTEDQKKKDIGVQDIQVVMLSSVVMYLILGMVLEYIRRSDILILIMCTSLAVLKIAVGIYDIYADKDAEFLNNNNLHLVHFIVILRLAMSTIFLTGLAKWFSVILLFMVVINYLYYIFDPIDADLLLNEQAIVLSTKYIDQYKTVISVEDFFAQYHMEKTDSKYSIRFDDQGQIKKPYSIQEQQKNQDEEAEEKILKRWKVPSFLSTLKINGVLRSLLCHSILFFKFRFINKIQIVATQNVISNDILIVIQSQRGSKEGGNFIILQNILTRTQLMVFFMGLLALLELIEIICYFLEIIDVTSRFWISMGYFEGIVIYSLYYMLCICGSIDLAKIQMLRNNVKIVGMLYCYLQGVQTLIQTLFFDYLINNYIKNGFYDNSVYFYLVNFISFFCSLVALYAIYGTLEKEISELKCIPDTRERTQSRENKLLMASGSGNYDTQNSDEEIQANDKNLQNDDESIDTRSFQEARIRLSIDYKRTNKNIQINKS